MEVRLKVGRHVEFDLVVVVVVVGCLLPAPVLLSQVLGRKEGRKEEDH